MTGNRQKLMRKKDRGFALVMVLIIVLILATITTEITLSSRINAKITANLRDGTKAFYLAKSGIAMGMQRIRMDTIAHQILSSYIGNSNNLTEFWWTVPLMYPLGSDMFGEMLEESNIDKSQIDAFGKSQDIGGSFISEISDESSRLNVNDMQLATNTPNGAYAVLVNLLSLPKFNRFFKYKNPQEVANKLVDWIDPNSELAGIGGGIEDADYADYHVKNTALFSPSELKLVKEVDSDLFSELEDFITVFPYSVPQSTVPLSTINVNTAPREIIAALFDPGVITEPWKMAGEIIKLRDEGAIFNKKEEFESFLQDKFDIDPKATPPAISRAVSNIIGIRSDYFRIKSTGVVEEAMKTITAVIDRKQKPNSIIYWRID